MRTTNHPVGRPRVAIATAIAVAVVVAASLAVTVTPVAAECTGPPTSWPTFGHVAPTAKRIVVGTVVESFDGATTGGTVFDLAVEEVLRGRRTNETIEIQDLRSGVPVRRPGACEPILSASVGDRIAIALGGKIPGVKGRVSTAAWVDQDPSYLAIPGAQRLSLRKVRKLSGHVPDGSSLPADHGVRRAPVPLGESIRQLREGVDRFIRDAEAVLVCSSLLDDIPMVEVASGRPSLAAAYGMTGPEYADYLAYRAVAAGIEQHPAVIKSAWQGTPGVVDVCIIDGDLTTPPLGSSGQDAKRVLAYVQDGEPRFGFAARQRLDEIPILFDFQRKAFGASSPPEWYDG